ncbi:phosphomannomutase/phosphoglucomutase, partial [Klebsiella pneumoniae]
HHPDPTIEANLRDLRETVVARQLDFGFAFDGDGDRLGLVDARGRVIWGDELLLILAQDMLQRHPGARILADVKTSMRVFEAIAD